MTVPSVPAVIGDSTALSVWFRFADLPVTSDRKQLWQYTLASFKLRGRCTSVLGLMSKDVSMNVAIVLQGTSRVDVVVTSVRGTTSQRVETASFPVLCMEDEHWHHLLVAFSSSRSSTCSLWLNTLFSGTEPLGSLIQSVTLQLALGTESSLGSIAWHEYLGSTVHIGTVSIFSKELSMVEHLTLYAGGPALDCGTDCEIPVFLPLLHETIVGRHSVPPDQSSTLVSLPIRFLRGGSVDSVAAQWSWTRTVTSCDVNMEAASLPGSLFDWTRESDASGENGVHDLPVAASQQFSESSPSGKICGEYISLRSGILIANILATISGDLAGARVGCDVSTTSQPIRLNEVDVKWSEAIAVDSLKVGVVAPDGDEPQAPTPVLLMDGSLSVECSLNGGAPRVWCSQSYGPEPSSLFESSVMDADGPSEDSESDASVVEEVVSKGNILALRLLCGANVFESRSPAEWLAGLGGLSALLPLMDMLYRSAVEPIWFHEEEGVVLCEEESAQLIGGLHLEPMKMQSRVRAKTQCWATRAPAISAVVVSMVADIYARHSELRYLWDLGGGWELLSWYWNYVAPSFSILNRTLQEARPLCHVRTSVPCVLRANSELCEAVCRVYMGPAASPVVWGGGGARLCDIAFNVEFLDLHGFSIGVHFVDSLRRACEGSLGALSSEALLVDGEVFDLVHTLTCFERSDRGRVTVSEAHSYQLFLGSCALLFRSLFTANSQRPSSGDLSRTVSMPCYYERLSALVAAAATSCDAALPATPPPNPSDVFGQEGATIAEVCLAVACDAAVFDPRPHHSVWDKMMDFTRLILLSERTPRRVIALALRFVGIVSLLGVEDKRSSYAGAVVRRCSSINAAWLVCESVLVSLLSISCGVPWKCGAVDEMWGSGGAFLSTEAEEHIRPSFGGAGHALAHYTGVDECLCTVLQCHLGPFGVSVGGSKVVPRAAQALDVCPAFLNDLFVLISQPHTAYDLHLKVLWTMRFLWGASMVLASQAVPTGALDVAAIMSSQLGVQDTTDELAKRRDWREAVCASILAGSLVDAVESCADELLQESEGIKPEIVSRRLCVTETMIFVADIVLQSVIRTNSNALLTSILRTLCSRLAYRNGKSRDALVFAILTFTRSVVRGVLSLCLSLCGSGEPRKVWQDRLGGTVVDVSHLKGKQLRSILKGMLAPGLAAVIEVYEYLQDTTVPASMERVLWDCCYLLFLGAISRIGIASSMEISQSDVYVRAVVGLIFSRRLVTLQRVFTAFVGPFLWVVSPLIGTDLTLISFVPFVDDPCVFVAYGARCAALAVCSGLRRRFRWGRPYEASKLETLFGATDDGSRLTRLCVQGVIPMVSAGLFKDEADIQDAAWVLSSVPPLNVVCDPKQGEGAVSVLCEVVHIAIARSSMGCAAPFSSLGDFWAAGEDSCKESELERAAYRLQHRVLVTTPLLPTLPELAELADDVAHVCDVGLDGSIEDIVEEFISMRLSSRKSIAADLSRCIASVKGVLSEDRSHKVDSILGVSSDNVRDVELKISKQLYRHRVENSCGGAAAEWSDLMSRSSGPRGLWSRESMELSYSAAAQLVVAINGCGISSVPVSCPIIPVADGVMWESASTAATLRTWAESSSVKVEEMEYSRIPVSIRSCVRLRPPTLSRGTWTEELQVDAAPAPWLQRAGGAATVGEHTLHLSEGNGSPLGCVTGLCLGAVPPRSVWNDVPSMASHLKFGKREEMEGEWKQVVSGVLEGDVHLSSFDYGVCDWSSALATASPVPASSAVEPVVKLDHRSQICSSLLVRSFSGMRADVPRHVDTLEQMLHSPGLGMEDVNCRRYVRCLLLGPFASAIPGILLFGAIGITFLGGEEKFYGGKRSPLRVLADMDTLGPLTAPATAASVPWKRSVSVDIADIRYLLPCRYLYRDIAAEMVLFDGRHLRFAFDCVKYRDTVVAALSVGTSVDLRTVRGPNLEEPRWTKGNMSNWDFLTGCNVRAGRSTFDIMQYPIFPFVLGDVYRAEAVDLSIPGSFRRLDLPTGNQEGKPWSPEPMACLLGGAGDFKFDPSESPYGCAFHSVYTGIVRFLCRASPFCYALLTNQGAFESPQRSFRGLSSFYSLSSSSSDVHEALGEFYSTPWVFENRHRFKLGVQDCTNRASPVSDVQGASDRVDDVILPPWAGGSARRFVKVMRAALESAYVSANLHHWLDMIFGFTQSSEEAHACGSVYARFHYEEEMENESEEVRVTAAMMGTAPTRIFTEKMKPRLLGPTALTSPSLATAPSWLRPCRLVRSIVDISDYCITRKVRTLFQSRKEAIQRRYPLWGEELGSTETGSAIRFWEMVSERSRKLREAALSSFTRYALVMQFLLELRGSRCEDLDVSTGGAVPSFMSGHSDVSSMDGFSSMEAQGTEVMDFCLWICDRSADTEDFPYVSRSGIPTCLKTTRRY